MNKKLVALFLSLGLAGTLAACGGETTTPEATPAGGGATPAAPAGGATPATPAAPAGGAKSTEKTPAAGEKSPAAGEKSPAAGEKGEKSPAATPATKTP